MFRKLPLIAAIGSLAVAAPAAAKYHPWQSNHHSNSAANGCKVHNKSLVASGTFVSWNATANGDGTYSGSITVQVRRANHHGKSLKGTQYTFTLNHSKVRFRKGANPPAAGDRVKVHGRITEVHKQCTDTTGTGVITVHRVLIRTPGPNEQ